MAVSDEDLQLLGSFILTELRGGFLNEHMSGNLTHTIKAEFSNGKFTIDIPAQTYNMLLYQTKGVVVHTSHGSYASKLNENGSEFFIYPYGTRKGSFRITPHNHVGFVDKAIEKGVQQWLDAKANVYQFKERKEEN